jgi:hypothetical protein
MYAMMKKTSDVLEGKMNPTRADDDEDYETENRGYSTKTPLIFVSGRCNEIIDAIPMAISDDKHIGKAEDVLKQPTKSDDVCDCFRYGCKSMLNARKTPFPVEAAEKRVEMEQSGRNMTEVAIQMQKMAAAARKRSQGRRTTWAR